MPLSPFRYTTTSSGRQPGSPNAVAGDEGGRAFFKVKYCSHAPQRRRARLSTLKVLAKLSDISNTFKVTSTYLSSHHNVGAIERKFIDAICWLGQSWTKFLSTKVILFNLLAPSSMSEYMGVFVRAVKRSNHDKIRIISILSCV